MKFKDSRRKSCFLVNWQVKMSFPLLNLVHEAYLFGSIHAMGAVRLPGHNTDALIICFEDWKVSILEWDNSIFDFSIISLHNFDRKTFSKEGPTQFTVPPQVLVDYKSRCACILVTDDYLAVIPFVDARNSINIRKKNSASQGNSNEFIQGNTTMMGVSNLLVDSTSSSSVSWKHGVTGNFQSGQSFLVHLAENGVRNIRDIKFLHGYYEPALMILYEPLGAWVGCLGVLSQSFSVSIMTLDLARQQCMIVWSVSHLPYDCSIICPLVNPVGGALILASCSIIYLDHSSRYKLILNKFGIETNSDNATCGKFVVEQSDLVISLDSANYCFLNEKTLLVSDQNSDYFVVQLLSDGRTIIHIDIARAFHSIRSNGLIKLEKNYVIITSKVSDSIVLEYKGIYPNKVEETAERSTPDIPEEELIHNKSVLDNEFDPSIVNGIWGESSLIDDDEKSLLALIQKRKATPTSESVIWKFEFIETIVSIAPMSDLTLRPINNSLDSCCEVMASCGYDKNGSLVVIRDGIRPDIKNALYFENYEAIWCLYFQDRNSKNSYYDTENLSIKSNQDYSSNSVDHDENSPARIDTLNEKYGREFSDTSYSNREYEGYKRKNSEISKDSSRNKMHDTKKIKALDRTYSDTLNSYEVPHENNEKNLDLSQSEEQRKIKDSSSNCKEESHVSQEKSANDPSSKGSVDSGKVHKFLLVSRKEDSELYWVNDNIEFPFKRVSDRSEVIRRFTKNAGNVHNGDFFVLVHDYDVTVCSGISIIDIYEIETNDDEVYILWSDIKDEYVAVLLEDNTIIVLMVTSEGKIIEKMKMKKNASTISLFRDRSSILGFNGLNKNSKKMYERMETSVEKKTHESSLKDNSINSMGDNDNKTSENTRREEKCSNSNSIQNKNSSAIETNQGGANSQTDSLDFIFFNDEEYEIERVNDPLELLMYDIRGVKTQPRKDKKSKIQWGSKPIPEQDIERPMYLFLVTQEGTLEIYRLTVEEDEEMYQCLYRCAGLNNARNRLEYDFDTKNYWRLNNITVDQISNLPRLLELRAEHLGSPSRLPFLVCCFDDGNIIAYSCYFYSDPLAPENALPIRFCKLAIPTISCNLQEPSWDESQRNKFISRQKREWDHPRIRYFDNISGHQGFFIAGEQPMWLFCIRDTLRFQRMRGVGSVVAFSSFHSKFCPNGYIYQSQKTPSLMIDHNENSETLNLCQLDSRWNFECSAHGTSILRFPIGKTPHSVTHDPKTGVTICVLTKRIINMKRYAIGAFDDTKEAQRRLDEEGGVHEMIVENLDPYLPPVYDEKAEIIIFDKDFNCAIEASFFLPEEWGTGKFLSLDFYSGNGGHVRTDFFVLCTSIARGEDAICKGRILVFNVHKGRLVLKFAKGRKSPIAAIEAINGLLVTSEGRQLYIYQIRAKEGLYPIAFFDAQLASVSLTVIKNYILFGDVHKSIQFLRWVDSAKTLELLAKDSDRLSVFATSMISYQNWLTLVLSDDQANIHFFVYDPLNPRSFDGSRLISTGDIYFGSLVKKIMRFHARSISNSKNSSNMRDSNSNNIHKDYTNNTNSNQNLNTNINPNQKFFKKNSNSDENVVGVYLAGLDGSLSYLLPIPKDIFELLRKLEGRLVENLEHVAGLHPYAYRLTRTRYRLNHSHIRAILDGELLWKFVHLEYVRKEQIAASIGARSVSEILDYLIRFHVQAGYLL